VRLPMLHTPPVSAAHAINADPLRTGSTTISSVTSRPLRELSGCQTYGGQSIAATRSVPEFLAYPSPIGKINFASGGNGTAQHLAGELFR